MKPISVLILLSCLILAACSSSQQQGTLEPLSAAVTPIIPVTAAAATQSATQGSTGQSLSNSTAIATPEGGKNVTDLSPEISWDPSPDALIISATNCCGFVPEFVKINYIPEAQVWGDGRVIWTQFDANNQRQVLQGQLTQEQMADFLQQATEAGFFGWDELYTSQNAPTDMPSKCIYIQLEGQSREVCEYYEGAPQAFHELYNDLDNGLGLEGQPYLPEKGYLVAYPVEGSGQAGLPAWNSQETSLVEAVNGAWIEGSDLEAAWKLVNEQPYGAAIEEGGTVYRISLQIPAVSFIAPPEQ